MALVLTAGGIVCALAMLGLHAAVAAGEPGVHLSAAPFFWFGVLAWLAFAGTVIGAHRLLIARQSLLKATAARLAADAPSPSPWLEPATETEENLYFLAEHIVAARCEREDARLLGRALLQIGGHYTLLCTLDGRLIDANPAFLARTGISPDAPRQQRDDRLAEIVHLPPLLDMARRSLETDAALTGIAYQIRVGDQLRPVALALRALSLRSGPAVVIVMSDKTHAAELERQIDQFTDALELMVDQRVARLTAGRTSIEEAVAQAGVGVFVFDRYAKTESLNRAAEILTGRTRSELVSFDDVAAALAPHSEAAQRIKGWFWQHEAGSLLEEIPAPAGRRRALMLSGAERHGAEVVRRVLVIVAAPDLPAATPEDAPAARPPAFAETGSPLRRLGALVARLDPHDFAPASRTYVEVIREAVRRLDAGGTGGDGAAPDPVRIAG